MTVKDLRRHLRGAPEDAVLAITFHDNQEGELQGTIYSLDVVDPEDAAYCGAVADAGAGRAVVVLKL
ncbi:hypothetical protein [Azospirillum argentinense]